MFIFKDVLINKHILVIEKYNIVKLLRIKKEKFYNLNCHDYRLYFHVIIYYMFRLK